MDAQAKANYALAKKKPLAEVTLREVAETPEAVQGWGYMSVDTSSRSPFRQQFMRCLKKPCNAKDHETYRHLPDAMKQKLAEAWGLRRTLSSLEKQDRV